MADNATFRKYALAFIVIFSIYTIYLAYWGDSIAMEIQGQIIQGHYLTAYGWYFFGQPSVWLIMIGLFLLDHRTVFQNISAGVLINLSFDQISFPHCLSQIAQPTINTVQYLCSDTISIISMITHFHVSYVVAWTLYYVILPILFLIIAARILGLIKFGKNIHGMMSSP